MSAGGNPIMYDARRCARIRVSIVLLSLSVASIGAAQKSGCVSGAATMAEAYVRASPVYSVLFTDLRSFIAENREHFVAGGDAVRCADALTRRDG